MKKFNSMVLLCLGVSVSSVAIAADDPCLTISGNWSGKFQQNMVNGQGKYLGLCYWNDTASIGNFGSTVSMHNELSPAGCTFSCDQRPGFLDYSGECVNAKLTLDQGVAGTDINNRISLNGPAPYHVAYSLTKTSNAVVAFQHFTHHTLPAVGICKETSNGYVCSIQN